MHPRRTPHRLPPRLRPRLPNSFGDAGNYSFTQGVFGLTRGKFACAVAAVCFSTAVILGACSPATPSAPDTQALEGSDRALEKVATGAAGVIPPAAPALSITEATPTADPSPAQPTDAVDTSIRDADAYGDDAFVANLAPAGWKQVGDIEHYNVASLYDKINGRSELYMAYDVRGLSWVSFALDGDTSTFIDLFIYDMQSPTGAFGIYSVERETGQEKVDLGRAGYKTGSNFFFWKGNYYGYIQAAKDSEAIDAAALAVSKGVLDRVTDDGGAVIGLDKVPTNGMVEDSVQFFRADALSLDFMNNTFTAKYAVGDQAVTGYMTWRGSEAEAAEIVGKFVDYLKEYGESPTSKTIDGVEIHMADLGGGFMDSMFQLGSTVAGLTSTEGAELTEKGAAHLIALLKAQ